jgi:hypothetical protein
MAGGLSMSCGANRPSVGLTNLNRVLNTVAKLKPATCQNHTLVTRKPNPRTAKPPSDTRSAANAIPQACHYAGPP